MMRGAGDVSCLQYKQNITIALAFTVGGVWMAGAYNRGRYGLDVFLSLFFVAQKSTRCGDCKYENTRILKKK